MLTSHELFGFMSPALAVRIIEFTHDNNKELYRNALSTVAEARKLRPAFLERMPRATRHTGMASILSRPRLELIAANILRQRLRYQQIWGICIARYVCILVYVKSDASVR